MKENQYSIKDLENLTSIKAHTIRIWEQRYGLLSPQRTETNIRYYSDQDLKKLLNVNLLYTNGLKISKIAKLSTEEIRDKSKELLQSTSKAVNTDIDAILMAIIDLDSNRINTYLENAFEDMGIEDLYTEIVIPLLNKVGELWQVNTISVGHEHFFSNLLREFILSKTHELNESNSTSKRALFFLHADEQHELSLLIYHYLFKAAGWQVCYLGQNVPLEDLKITCDQFQPDVSITCFIKHLSESEFINKISEIGTVIPSDKLLIGGSIAMVYKNNIPFETPLISDATSLKPLFV